MMLNNVRVIDGTGRVWEQAAVYIEGEYITDVTAPVALLAEGELLDLSGRTVIPGLINCHTHVCLDGSPDPVSALVARTPTENVLLAAQHAADALRAGVTTVRDLGGWQGIDLGLKKAIRAGLAPGPRMLVSGRPLCMTGGQAHALGREVDGADEAAGRLALRRGVRRREGVLRQTSAPGGGSSGCVSPGGYASSASSQLMSSSSPSSPKPGRGGSSCASSGGSFWSPRGPSCAISTSPIPVSASPSS